MQEEGIVGDDESLTPEGEQLLSDEPVAPTTEQLKFSEFLLI
jgi:hypothetical protein